MKWVIIKGMLTTPVNSINSLIDNIVLIVCNKVQLMIGIDLQTLR